MVETLCGEQAPPPLAPHITLLGTNDVTKFAADLPDLAAQAAPFPVQLFSSSDDGVREDAVLPLVGLAEN